MYLQCTVVYAGLKESAVSGQFVRSTKLSGETTDDGKVTEGEYKMEKAYFPMFVDISKKKIVVIGGGKIAARRVKTLLIFAEDITVIAPDICDTLWELSRGGSIQCRKREFWTEDIQEAQIVLAATDRREINAEIVRYCREHGILVNTADDKGACDFYFPSVVKKGNVIIGINSGGDSPEEVKRVRKEIEESMEESSLYEE